MKYAAPTTVEEAQALLADAAGAAVFAGATDLVPQMRAGRPEPSVAVDLKKIDRLMALSQSGHTWTIGAAVPTAELTRNEAFVADFPGLSHAAGLIGSDQIQNRASLGGNLCNGSPAADSVPALVVNQARAVIVGSHGTRTVPVDEVVTGPGTTSLAPGEFVVEFQIDQPAENTADAYLRITPRTEMDIAIVGAAARITMDNADNCTAACIALGAVAPTVVRVSEAEAALVGGPITDQSLAAVAAAATAACNPIDDKRGTIVYRRQVAGVLARRVVARAADQAANRGAP
ncbi:MAG: xanthine dehydrogenase family protein subunit M [Acidimicrobiales bacterium]